MSVRPRRLRRMPGVILPPLCTVLLIVLAWLALTSGDRVPEYVIPSPGAVLESLRAEWPGRLGRATRVTAVETVAGVLLGVAAAGFAVIAAGLVPLVGRALTPLLIVSQAVPVIVIGPILTIALGYGPAPKIIVVALLCFFPVALNLLSGIESPDPRLLDTLRSLHQGRAALLWRVRLPHALPGGFAGLRISVIFAPVAAVFSEYAGATDGLGFLMLQSIPRLQTDFVFAQVIVLTIMASLLLLVVVGLERLACPWRTTTKGPPS